MPGIPYPLLVAAPERCPWCGCAANLCLFRPDEGAGFSAPHFRVQCMNSGCGTTGPRGMDWFPPDVTEPSYRASEMEAQESAAAAWNKNAAAARMLRAYESLASPEKRAAAALAARLAVDGK